MPGKLKIVMGLYAISVVLNIINQGWIAAVIGILIIAGLLKGNNVVRIVVIVLSVLGLVVYVLGALGLAAILAVGVGDALLPLLSIVFGLVSSIFTIYALTRQDVKDWMLNKGVQGMEQAG